MDKGLAGAPKWTSVGQGLDPQPFTSWSGSQMDKGWTPQIGLDPPTLHDLAGVPFQEADSFCYQILLI